MVRSLNPRVVVAFVVAAIAVFDASPARAEAPPASTAALAGPYAAENAANRAVGRVGLAVGRIRVSLETARRARDAVKTLCLHDKLVQAEAAERSATERRSELRTTFLDDAETTAHAAAVFDVLAQRADQLLAESTQCVGEEASFVGGAAGLRGAGGERKATEDTGKHTGTTYEVRMRDLEKRVEETKDQIRRSKTREALLSETVLAGGATGSATPAPQLGAPAAAVPPPGPPPAASPYARDAAHDSSMLIRTADLSLAVFEVDKNLDAVEATARELGGYLATKSDRQITIRVPRDRFDDAVKRIEKLGDVLHRNISAEDVTDQYVDIEMRLKNAYAVRARLEKLLESATVKDAIEIQKELGKTTEEIERLEGKLKLLRDRIGYSTVNVTFERTQPQKVGQHALLPFPWMSTMGLGPLLTVPR